MVYSSHTNFPLCPNTDRTWRTIAGQSCAQYQCFRTEDGVPWDCLPQLSSPKKNFISSTTVYMYIVHVLFSCPNGIRSSIYLCLNRWSIRNTEYAYYIPVHERCEYCTHWMISLVDGYIHVQVTKFIQCTCMLARKLDTSVPVLAYMWSNVCWDSKSSKWTLLKIYSSNCVFAIPDAPIYTRTMYIHTSHN